MSTCIADIKKKCDKCDSTEGPFICWTELVSVWVEAKLAYELRDVSFRRCVNCGKLLLTRVQKKEKNGNGKI